MDKKGKVKKRRRINYKRVTVLLLGLYLFVALILYFYNLPIKNIYIHNNQYLSDQTIIELAGISDYPSTFKFLSSMISNKLKKSTYILNAKVYKKNLTEVHIEVTENKPLFFNKILNKTILQNGAEVNDKFVIPTLINYVPDIKYKELIEKMASVKDDVLIRISEIEYDPNEVDDSRFLLSMNDGNYVYITISRFENINSYIDIIKKFDNKKGILYLDYGNSFTVIES